MRSACGPDGWSGAWLQYLLIVPFLLFVKMSKKGINVRLAKVGYVVAFVGVTVAEVGLQFIKKNYTYLYFYIIL